MIVRACMSPTSDTRNAVWPCPSWGLGTNAGGKDGGHHGHRADRHVRPPAGNRWLAMALSYSNGNFCIAIAPLTPPPHPGGGGQTSRSQQGCWLDQAGGTTPSPLSTPLQVEVDRGGGVCRAEGKNGWLDPNQLAAGLEPSPSPDCEIGMVVSFVALPVEYFLPPHFAT